MIYCDDCREAGPRCAFHWFNPVAKVGRLLDLHTRGIDRRHLDRWHPQQRHRAQAHRHDPTASINAFATQLTACADAFDLYKAQNGAYPNDQSTGTPAAWHGAVHQPRGIGVMPARRRWTDTGTTQPLAAAPMRPSVSSTSTELDFPGPGRSWKSIPFSTTAISPRARWF